MRIGPRGLRQRYRGHAGSWAASTLARFGALLAAALILLSGLMTDAAAGTLRASADPSPQKAPPAVSSSTPAPDPAPQTAPRSQSSHSTPPATQSAPLTQSSPPPVIPSSLPATTTPANPAAADSTGPSQPTSASARVATSPSVNRQAPAPHRPLRGTHAPRHGAPAPATKSQRISLSFPLATLTKDLFRLPRAALHAGEAGRAGGVLLLLSAVAMGVVAVSGFSLLRRLKRLEGHT